MAYDSAICQDVGEVLQEAPDQGGRSCCLPPRLALATGAVQYPLVSRNETRFVSVATLTDPDFFTPAPAMEHAAVGSLIFGWANQGAIPIDAPDAVGDQPRQLPGSLGQSGRCRIRAGFGKGDGDAGPAGDGPSFG